MAAVPSVARLPALTCFAAPRRAGPSPGRRRVQTLRGRHRVSVT
ncbi:MULTISPECIES: hypothetical protein [Parafrankia]|nr:MULTISPECIES: hypothetical protein [Parafrankia]